jgi:hypothetical protein
MMNKSFIFSVSVLSFCILSAGPQDTSPKKSGIDFYIEKARKNRNPTFFHQLQTLKPLLSDKAIYLGVPEEKREAEPKYASALMNYWFGNYKLIPKQYFLLKGFEDIEHAFENDHYELYLMPNDAHLYDTVDALVKFLNNFYSTYYKSLKDVIAFIAVRPTPGITKSPFNGKPMPRIIVGFKPNAYKDEYSGKLLTAERYDFQYPIYHLNKEVGVKKFGCLGIPRYSKEFEKSCIFWAYGSADFKDSAAGRKIYKTSNMVYPTENLELFEPGWRSKTHIIEEGEETLDRDTRSGEWRKIKMINGRLEKIGKPTETEIAAFRQIKKE